MKKMKFLSPVSVDYVSSANMLRRDRMLRDKDSMLVVPGDVISSETGYLKGHGTYSKFDHKKQSSRRDSSRLLVASVRGRVEKVSKLLSVTPAKSRYSPQVGDVVVGRIVEIGKGKWLCDINSQAEAALHLSAINLPGGVQRKRTYLDELNMRSFFIENEMFSAEVQAINHDGSIALHTRGNKYRKLGKGLLITVHSSLILRVRSHFHDFNNGVRMICGVNGYIWLFNEEENSSSMLDEVEYLVPPQIARVNLIRISNSIKVLASQKKKVFPSNIELIYVTSQSLNMESSQMLDKSNSIELVKHLQAYEPENNEFD